MYNCRGRPPWMTVLVPISLSAVSLDLGTSRLCVSRPTARTICKARWDIKRRAQLHGPPAASFQPHPGTRLGLPGARGGSRFILYSLRHTTTAVFDRQQLLVRACARASGYVRQSGMWVDSQATSLEARCRILLQRFGTLGYNLSPSSLETRGRLRGDTSPTPCLCLSSGIVCEDRTRQPRTDTPPTLLL